LDKKIEVSELFELHDEQYRNFQAIENKLSNRTDLHALMYLDKLFPEYPIQTSHGDEFYHWIIASATLDEIQIALTPEQVESLTSEQVLELVRCGVRYDAEDSRLELYI